MFLFFVQFLLLLIVNWTEGVEGSGQWATCSRDTSASTASFRRICRRSALRLLLLMEVLDDSCLILRLFIYFFNEFVLWLMLLGFIISLIWFKLIGWILLLILYIAIPFWLKSIVCLSVSKSLFEFLAFLFSIMIETSQLPIIYLWSWLKTWVFLYPILYSRFFLKKKNLGRCI